MISAQDFYASPKYIALRAKVEDRLNAIPDYARAKAEMEDASNRCKEDGRQMKKSDATVAQAKLDEKKAKIDLSFYRIYSKPYLSYYFRNDVKENVVSDVISFRVYELEQIY